MTTRLLIATVLLAWLSTASYSQTPSKSYGKVLELPFGKDRLTSIQHIREIFENARLSEIRKTTDPVQKATIRRNIKDVTEKLAAGLFDTSKERGIYRLSPLANFVAVGPKSSVFRELTTGRERWLLFHNDRLYGTAISLDSTVPLPNQVSDLSAVFGRPETLLRDSVRSSGAVIGARWTDGEYSIVLRAFDTEYGVRLVVKLHKEHWVTARKATQKNLLDRGPSDKAGADKLMDEFISP